ncbi:MAG: cytochrome c biogenesis protein CcdA [Patescibacteria group bacterium]
MVIQLSLLASFIAGMIALFAPCCVTFLLPAYFANIFKEKKRVLLMTFIYSLGIFTVMLPVVLGARVLTQIFLDLHDQTYIIGGLFLIFVGFLGLLGIKLPMPHIVSNRQVADDPVSTYILGIIGGITSACCAPVLIGVLALTTLSPTLPLALLTGFFYVLGMVAPLYLASLFIEKGNFLASPILRRPIFGRVTLSNLISFIMFVGLGLLLIFLSLTGRLSMSGAEEATSRAIQSAAANFTALVGKVPGLDLVFSLLAAFLLYKFIKAATRK